MTNQYYNGGTLSIKKLLLRVPNK